MGFKRISDRSGWVDPKKLPQGPNGRALCRWCNKEVPVGCRTFCSDVCVDNHKILTQPSYVRQKLFNRDKGICAQCGLDTIALEARLKAVPTQERYKATYTQEYPEWARKRTWTYYGISLWEADHITPIVEDGGECGLEGYRTLCAPCHRIETNALLVRRKEQRRLAKEGL